MSETAGRGPSSCEAGFGVWGHQASVKEGARGRFTVKEGEVAKFQVPVKDGGEGVGTKFM